MKCVAKCIAAITAMLVCVGSAQAGTTLLYDMEGADPSGFGPNGFPVPSITQDTIGATEGTNSMRVETLGGATFVGALTAVVPAGLNNPPGVDSILFDMTIDQGGGYNGAGFAGVGATIFGFKGATFGIGVQFDAFQAIGNTPGTTEVELSLGSSVQAGFVGKSFNEILDEGLLDGITGLQLFFNQTGDSNVVVYIDNIRSSFVPEPATGLLLCLGMIGAGLVRRRRS